MFWNPLCDLQLHLPKCSIYYTSFNTGLCFEEGYLLCKSNFLDRHILWSIEDVCLFFIFFTAEELSFQTCNIENWRFILYYLQINSWGENQSIVISVVEIFSLQSSTLLILDELKLFPGSINFICRSQNIFIISSHKFDNLGCCI